MNKFPHFLCFFMLLCITAIAQNQAEPGDSLLRQQLLMTKYDKDTSAVAVVLSDIGAAYIRDDGKIFQKFSTRTTSIKILTETGISKGLFSFTLYRHNQPLGENIVSFKATTYNLENGKIVAASFNMNQMVEEKNSTYDIERIAMPNVKIGSVIVMSYTIKSSNIGYFQWAFQREIPVKLSSFNIIMPPFFIYKSLQQNMDTTKLIKIVSKDIPKSIFSGPGYSGTNEYDDIMYTFAYKDIPAFKVEGFLPCKDDYLTKVSFQFSKIDSKGYLRFTNRTFNTTWKQFTDRLLLDFTYFGGYLYSKDNYLEKEADKLNLDGKPQMEKIKTVVNYVKANYKWNGAYDILSDKKMDDFVNQKSGNSAAINLFLTAMFRAAHINADPVIFSTRSHGEIKTNYPFVGFYNDVICHVQTDSITLLLDATEPLLPYYATPPQCLNDRGLIVKSNDSQWVSLKPRMTSIKIEKMVIKLSPKYDSVNTNFTIKANGYLGYEYRREWNEGYDKFSQMLTEDKGMEIKDSVKTFSVKNPEESMSVTFSAGCPLIRQKIDSASKYRIIFSPFLNEPLRENPLKAADREYPVDMNYQREYKYQSFVVIPDGYKIQEEPSEVDNSALKGKASFSYGVKQISNNVIQFSCDLNFKEPVFNPDEYKELKAFYDMVIKKYKEPIILEQE